MDNYLPQNIFLKTKHEHAIPIHDLPLNYQPDSTHSPC